MLSVIHGVSWLCIKTSHWLNPVFGQSSCDSYVFVSSSGCVLCSVRNQNLTRVLVLVLIYLNYLYLFFISIALLLIAISNLVTVLSSSNIFYRSFLFTLS
jgi:hypothetical protein